MVSKEREMELISCWYSEQCDSWRDDCEESEKWREDLTDEERQLVEGWDRETPEEELKGMGDRGDGRGPIGCCGTGQDEPGERGDRMPVEVDILGTAYTVRLVCGSDDPRMSDSDGFCDETTKEIFAETYENEQGAQNSKKDLKAQSEKVLRHEIVHAFLVESGLAECSEWAQNEEAVDWFARQGPKIFKAWLQAKAVRWRREGDGA